jgi:IS5 family transposase
MYQKHHNGQLSIEDFHVPFGGTLDSDNRWVIFSSLMPWEELEAALCASVQSYHWRPCKACEAGVWRAVHQAAAWLDR